MAFAKITLIGAINYFNNTEESLFDFLELPEGLDKETLIDDIVYRGSDFELLHINPEYTRMAIGAFSKKWAYTWQKWYDVINEEYEPLWNIDRFEEVEDKNTGTQSNNTSGTEATTNTGNQRIDNTGSEKRTNTGTQENDSNVSTTENGLSHEEVSGNKAGSSNQNHSDEKTKSAFDSSTYQPYESTTAQDVNSNSELTSAETDSNDIRNHSGVEKNTRTDNLEENKVDSSSQYRTDNLSENRTLSNNGVRTDNLKFEHYLHAYGNGGVTMSQQMLEAEINVRKWNIYHAITDMFLETFCLLIY